MGTTLEEAAKTCAMLLLQGLVQKQIRQLQKIEEMFFFVLGRKMMKIARLWILSGGGRLFYASLARFLCPKTK